MWNDKKQAISSRISKKKISVYSGFFQYIVQLPLVALQSPRLAVEISMQF